MALNNMWKMLTPLKFFYSINYSLEVLDAASGKTQFFLLDVVTDPIRKLTFHWCGRKYLLSLLPNQIYLHENF